MSLKPLALAVALACVALPAAALYKLIGPDGRVTYTDRPPSDTSARVTTLDRESVIEAPAPDALPLALRQTVTRFPVTLYVSADCAPCDAGRQLLVQRGVPFTEKQIVTDDDAQAMERTLGSRTVPTLTIAAQALRGLSEGEWTAYLDAAGYPRQSQLPRGWQAPPAAPLVARSSAPAASAPARAAAPPVRTAPVPAPAVVLPSAPGGIRF